MLTEWGGVTCMVHMYHSGHNESVDSLGWGDATCMVHMYHSDKNESLCH